MGRHNIQFGGIRHTPSDITGKDGDLLDCVNLVGEYGEMKPFEMPVKTQVGCPGYTLAAVHNVTGARLSVFVDNSTAHSVVRAFDEEGAAVQFGAASFVSLQDQKVAWVETVGNTLVVGTDKSTHYAMYKNGAYKWLGDRMPQPVFKFDFRRSGTNTDEDGNAYTGYYINEYKPNTYALTYGGDTHAGGGIPLRPLDMAYEGGGEHIPIELSNVGEENRRIFRDGVRSRVEKALATARTYNVFVFPFFVRYAVRMYDGNHAMHSAPLLMLPSDYTNPLLAKIRIASFGSSSSPYTDSGGWAYSVAFDSVSFRGMELTLQFCGWADENGTFQDASAWDDVIKGVDIFMSSQVRSYDGSYWDDLDKVPTTFYCFDRTVDDGQGGYVDDPTVRDYGNAYSRNAKTGWWDVFDKTASNPQGDFDHKEQVTTPQYYGSGSYYKYYKIPLPSVNADSMEERLKEESLFYKVKGYDMASLSGAWQSERRFRNEVPRGTLDKLETLPQLQDDYVSRSRLASSVSYSYNQRLVLGNMGIQLPLWYQDTKTFQGDAYAVMAITFQVEKPEMTYYVPWTMHGAGHNDFGHYLYYPDPDCTAAIVSDGTTVRIVPMHEHAGLHGAYALMPGAGSLHDAFASFEQWTGALPEPSSYRYYHTPNAIAMSDAANPFRFTADNFKDIGRTRVIGIAANTLDVGYNQWGPYPLAVFCDDGIVNVTIDKEGRFGGVDAVSADVLVEPQGLSKPTLIQTGQSLVFVTARGVMAMAGSKVTCVSEAMNGRSFNPLVDLTPQDPPAAQYNVGVFADLMENAQSETSFRAFCLSGFLAYDYAHDRVLLLNEGEKHMYAFGMASGLWGKCVLCLNTEDVQLDEVPGKTSPHERSGYTLTTYKVNAAVNNYTEMYLQCAEDGFLYRTMDVPEENRESLPYQYGYMVSRPVRFGTDALKSLRRMLHRYTHYAENSFVRVKVFGSRDGVRYGQVVSLRGMGYKYFVFVIYTYLKPNERYSYLTVDFDERLTDKLR